MIRSVRQIGPSFSTDRCQGSVKPINCPKKCSSLINSQILAPTEEARSTVFFLKSYQVPGTEWTVTVTRTRKGSQPTTLKNQSRSRRNGTLIKSLKKEL
ncbi:hypothetical protein ElyMa_003890900 [Elysia marginata]|uniref:Uncharacterized protein n=1 Tax=Elysia marginata TaxID=1093978 RepID=A0AAV4FM35_9GAST|nr:hypothetical protein ElyMa_003890900 [Elysia marginata]